MDRAEAQARIAILGLGNELLTDDGVGVAVARELAACPPEGAQVAEVGTAVLYALDLIEAADVVIAIDAAHGPGAPGSLYRFDLDLAEESDREDARSMHDLGLAEALGLLAPEARPKRVTIVGIEPQRVAYGLSLTPPVRRAVAPAVELVRRLAAQALGEGYSGSS